MSPTSTIFLPSQGTTSYVNTLPAFSGTSSDALSGITAAGQVAISIKESIPAGNWWNAILLAVVLVIVLELLLTFRGLADAVENKNAFWTSRKAPQKRVRRALGVAG